MASTGLIVVGTVVGGLTANPAILGSMSGAGLALKTFSETKDYKKRIELCKFCYTTCSKVLVAGLPRARSARGTEPDTHRLW